MTPCISPSLSLSCPTHPSTDPDLDDEGKPSLAAAADAAWRQAVTVRPNRCTRHINSWKQSISLSWRSPSDGPCAVVSPLNAHSTIQASTAYRCHSSSAGWLPSDRITELLREALLDLLFSRDRPGSEGNYLQEQAFFLGRGCWSITGVFYTESVWLLLEGVVGLTCGIFMFQICRTLAHNHLGES